jgi:regulatory protein
MKITSIKAQIKNAGRVSVYVDGQYSFSLNHSQLLEQGLRSGLEIDELRLRELKDASEFGKAYDRSLNYVTIRPRSQREFMDYTKRKKWATCDAQQILNKLVERGYVNDERFASAWVESRKLNKAVSEKRLKLELKQKGITDKIIDQVLGSAGFSEQESLKLLITKKRRLTRYQDDKKLVQYLAGQGFKYEDIKRMLSQEFGDK